METPGTGGKWAARIFGSAFLSLGAAGAGFMYASYRNTSGLGGLDSALAAVAWAVLVGLLAFGAMFLPAVPRFFALAALLLLPWVPPTHKVARHWVYAFNVDRCRPLAGRSAQECRDADCQPITRCVPGGPKEEGLCLDTGSPLSSIRCEPKDGVCASMWPRCAGVHSEHCDHAKEGGVQVCQWNGSACVEKVSVCGGCQPIAQKCDALPFEVTWKAPWNKR
jgi:hypothetical protein